MGASFVFLKITEIRSEQVQMSAQIELRRIALLLQLVLPIRAKRERSTT